MAATKQGESNLVLFAALAANIGIAIAKFIAAAISGSSSMLTEGFHSVVDSTNQLLLLYGKHRGQRRPDSDHPFGYGRELYFWSFVVAILIFAIGAGVSVLEGLNHVRNPSDLEDPLLNYIVLGVAFAMEGTSWIIALRAFAAANPDSGWWAAVRRSKDPATLIVVFEDSGALIGLVIAAIGNWASHQWQDARLDGYASIAIGVVLGVIAVLLAREAKGLLIGESADPEVVAKVREIIDRYPEIMAVNHVRTIHTAPDSIFAAVSADFADEVTMGQAEPLIERIEAELKQALPSLASIYIRPESQAEAAHLPRKGEAA